MLGNHGSTPTWSHDATNGYYTVYSPKTTDSSGGNEIIIGEIPNNQNMEILFDWNTSYSGSPYNFVLKLFGEYGVWANYVDVGTWSSSKIARMVDKNGTVHSTNPSGRLSSGVWYTFKIRIENGQTTIQILNGSSVVVNYTVNEVIETDTITIIPFIMYNASTNYFRNIKVKAL